jgi:predicted nuclease with RNAse H fold
LTGNRFAGVDVGGSRKGFHAAVIDDRALVAGPTRLPDVATTVRWLVDQAPVVVAVDAPLTLGPRECERALTRHVCHLYFTPAALAGTFYDWMRNGFALYAALRENGLAAIECFPTGTWTILAGKRGDRSRQAWTKGGLAALRLAGIPSRLDQDGRDAICAAYTARVHARGHADPRFAPIAIPLA